MIYRWKCPFTIFPKFYVCKHIVQRVKKKKKRKKVGRKMQKELDKYANIILL